MKDTAMTMEKLNAGLIALAAALIVLLALPAAAEGPACGPRGAVVARLASHFGETRRGIGMGTDGRRVVEVFASSATGTWTILVTLPDGRACLVASGRHWEDRMDDLAHLADLEA
jgi:hypothetical protein